MSILQARALLEHLRLLSEEQRLREEVCCAHLSQLQQSSTVSKSAERGQDDGVHLMLCFVNA